MMAIQSRAIGFGEVLGRRRILASKITSPKVGPINQKYLKRIVVIQNH
jgi:regulator of extracellular matrix RemA (YlzA/DUF370 family)